jgi:hypothetical protein
MCNTSKTQAGIYELSKKERGFSLQISNVNLMPDADIWIPIVDINGAWIGDIHFTAFGLGYFGVNEIRQAPFLSQNLSDVYTRSLSPQKGET